MRCLPRTNSATGTSVTSAPLRRIERPVPKNRFFTRANRESSFYSGYSGQSPFVLNHIEPAAR
jgi:hypothetical protein